MIIYSLAVLNLLGRIAACEFASDIQLYLWRVNAEGSAARLLSVAFRKESASSAVLSAKVGKHKRLKIKVARGVGSTKVSDTKLPFYILGYRIIGKFNGL